MDQELRGAHHEFGHASRPTAWRARPRQQNTALWLELDAGAVGNRLSVEPETATHIDLLTMLWANQKTPERSEIMELFPPAVIQS